MNSRIKMISLGFLALIQVIALGSSAQAQSSSRKLTVTTFNIRFYGTGGEMEAAKEEYRDPSLKKFISSQIPATDVFAFEEIVDVERLNNILPTGWKCVSYNSTYKLHQHVVLCASPDYKLVREPNDTNDIIDDVSFDGGKSRPAMHMILADKTGKQLVRIVGVHLKAYPEESVRRQEQVNSISKYLEGVSNKNLPVIITGDFNTYSAQSTGQAKSDVELFSQTFNAHGLTYAPHPSKYTYRNLKGNNSKLDHFWISKSLKPVGTVKVFGVCNQNSVEASTVAPDPINVESFLEINYYYKNVSDHCPTTLSVNY